MMAWMSQAEPQYPAPPEGSDAVLEAREDGVIIRFPPRGVVRGYVWHVVFSLAFAAIGVVIWFFPGPLVISPIWWILVPGFILGGGLLLISTIWWGRRWISLEAGSAGISISGTYRRKPWRSHLEHADIMDVTSASGNIMVKTIFEPTKKQISINRARREAAWAAEVIRAALAKAPPPVPQPITLPQKSAVVCEREAQRLRITMPPDRKLFGGWAVALSCLLAFLTCLLIGRIFYPLKGNTTATWVGLGLLEWGAFFPVILWCFCAARHPTIFEMTSLELAVVRPFFWRKYRRAWKRDEIEGIIFPGGAIMLRRKGRKPVWGDEIIRSGGDRRELQWVAQTIRREMGL
jgi:hypothetical protein